MEQANMAKRRFCDDGNTGFLIINESIVLAGDAYVANFKLVSGLVFESIGFNLTLE
jgi:hypothetical protein